MQDQPIPGDSNSQFANWQRIIEERLRALETAPRVSSTSQRGGSFILLDEQGRTVWTFGEYQRGAVLDYGAQAIAPDGGPNPTSLEINGAGMEAPWIPMQVAKSGDFVVVTSSTYVDVFICTAGLLVSDSIEWFSVVACDGSTTADARLHIPFVKDSDVISCGAGAQTNLVWSWLHEQDLGGNLFVYLQVRRTSGAGNVNVYLPHVASQSGSAGTGATVGGT